MDRYPLMRRSRSPGSRVIVLKEKKQFKKCKWTFKYMHFQAEDSFFSERFWSSRSVFKVNPEIYFTEVWKIFLQIEQIQIPSVVPLMVQYLMQSLNDWKLFEL